MFGMSYRKTLGTLGLAAALLAPVAMQGASAAQDGIRQGAVIERGVAQPRGQVHAPHADHADHDAFHHPRPMTPDLAPRDNALTFLERSGATGGAGQGS